MTPFERVLLCHEDPLVLVFANFNRSASFLQHNPIESILLEITGIPYNEWIILRSVLEQNGLLIVEQRQSTIHISYLHFHPVLIPFLRRQRDPDNSELHERYIGHYCGLLSYLYDTDSSNPQSARDLAWRELPNIRRALNHLLKAGKGKVHSRTIMEFSHFLTQFGLLQELAELRRQVIENIGIVKEQTGKELSEADWTSEFDLALDELNKGYIQSATARTMALLARVEALKNSSHTGYGSHRHCITLQLLVRCLRSEGKIAEAEKRLYEALTIFDGLIKQKPDDKTVLKLQSTLLADVGMLLHRQEHYPQAQRAYQDALVIMQKQGDRRNQAALLGQLGQLAHDQHKYTEARLYLKMALELAQSLGDVITEAGVLHRLGSIARAEVLSVE